MLLLLLLLSHFSRVQLLCDPIDVSPLGSPVPGILQERTLEWIGLEMVKFDKDKRLDLFNFITTAFWVAVSEKTHE